MRNNKFSWRDLSLKDFKIYLFSLFKAFIPKKKNKKFRGFRKFYSNEISLGISSNTLQLLKNQNGY